MGAKLEFRYEGNKRIQFNSFCVEFRERMMLLKRIDLGKNAIEQKKTKPGLKFKPRIVLIRLEQLGPGLLLGTGHGVNCQGCNCGSKSMFHP